MKKYKIKQFPHCDSKVLHKSGECQYCDEHPDWQALRESWGIAFTGHEPKEGELPCPAYFARGENCQKWGGNVPQPDDLDDRFPDISYLLHPSLVSSVSIVPDASQEEIEELDNEIKLYTSPKIKWESGHKKLYDEGILDTTDKSVPSVFDSPAPNPAIDSSGQYKSYWVLSESERSKGFARPVRNSYIHTGTPGPKFPMRDLTEDEHRRYDVYGYVKFEVYPEGYKGSSTGKFWTQDDLDKIGKGCGTVTTMGNALAETYAAKPVGFYGSTFCSRCGSHYPVGEDGEFLWKGTNERVGT